MIKSFADKDTEKVWNREFTKSIPAVLIRRARMKLIMIDAATSLDVLRIPPSNHLEVLRGDRKGQHSISLFRNCQIYNILRMVIMLYLVSKTSEIYTFKENIMIDKIYA